MAIVSFLWTILDAYPSHHCLVKSEIASPRHGSTSLSMTSGLAMTKPLVHVLQNPQQEVPELLYGVNVHLFVWRVDAFQGWTE